MARKKFDIETILERLSKVRPVFHKEVDFQLALAWHIHKTIPGAEIRLEWKPFPEKLEYLDMWILSEGIAVELKYKTRKLDLSSNGENFALKNQGAPDQARYDFLKDIKRLEDVVKSKREAKRGFALLLTNNHLYWEAPKKKDTIDAKFRIHEGREVKGKMTWSKKAGAGSMQGGREKPIKLRGSYYMRWSDYKKLGDDKNTTFRYLLIEVKN